MPVIVPVIDSPVLETSEWLFSASLYLEEMEKAVGETKRRYRHEILTRERADDGPYGVHDAGAETQFEIDELENEVIPGFYRVLTYSFVSLLHSIVENQLNALALKLRERDAIEWKVKDVSGKGIRRARLYLSKAAGLDVATDPAWASLLHLGDLRNIIVHRGGQQGSDRKAVEKLLSQYAQELSLSAPRDSDYAEIVIPPTLCRRFLTEIREFFGRTFQRADLKGLEVYGWSDSS